MKSTSKGTLFCLCLLLFCLLLSGAALADEVGEYAANPNSYNVSLSSSVAQVNTTDIVPVEVVLQQTAGSDSLDTLRLVLDYDDEFLAVQSFAAADILLGGTGGTTITPIAFWSDGQLVITFSHDDHAAMLYYGLSVDDTVLGTINLQVKDRSELASNEGEVYLVVDRDATGLTNSLYSEEPALTAADDNTCLAQVRDVQLFFRGEAGKSTVTPSDAVAYCRYDSPGVYSSRSYDTAYQLPQVDALPGYRVLQDKWNTSSDGTGIAYDPTTVYSDDITFYPVVVEAVKIPVDVRGVDKNTAINTENTSHIAGNAFLQGKAIVSFSAGLTDDYQLSGKTVFSVSAAPGYKVTAVAYSINDKKAVDITETGSTNEYTMDLSYFGSEDKLMLYVHTQLDLTDVQIFTAADATGGERYATFSTMTGSRSLVVFALPQGITALDCNNSDDFSRICTLADAAYAYENAVLLDLTTLGEVSEQAVLDYLTDICYATDDEQPVVTYDTDINGSEGSMILDIQSAYDVYARTGDILLWDMPLGAMLKSDVNCSGSVEWDDVNILRELFRSNLP